MSFHIKADNSISNLGELIQAGTLHLNKGKGSRRCGYNRSSQDPRAGNFSPGTLKGCKAKNFGGQIREIVNTYAEFHNNKTFNQSQSFIFDAREFSDNTSDKNPRYRKKIAQYLPNIEQLIESIASYKIDELLAGKKIILPSNDPRVSKKNMIYGFKSALWLETKWTHFRVAFRARSPYDIDIAAGDYVRTRGYIKSIGIGQINTDAFPKNRKVMVDLIQNIFKAADTYFKPWVQMITKNEKKKRSFRCNEIKRKGSHLRQTKTSGKISSTKYENKKILITIPNINSLDRIANRSYSYYNGGQGNTCRRFSHSHSLKYLLIFKKLHIQETKNTVSYKKNRIQYWHKYFTPFKNQERASLPFKKSCLFGLGMKYTKRCALKGPQINLKPDDILFQINENNNIKNPLTCTLSPIEESPRKVFCVKDKFLHYLLLINQKVPDTITYQISKDLLQSNLKDNIQIIDLMKEENKSSGYLFTLLKNLRKNQYSQKFDLALPGEFVKITIPKDEKIKFRSEPNIKSEDITKDKHSIYPLPVKNGHTFQVLDIELVPEANKRHVFYLVAHKNNLGQNQQYYVYSGHLRQALNAYSYSKVTQRILLDEIPQMAPSFSSSSRKEPFPYTVISLPTPELLKTGHYYARIRSKSGLVRFNQETQSKNFTLDNLLTYRKIDSFRKKSPRCIIDSCLKQESVQSELTHIINQFTINFHPFFKKYSFKIKLNNEKFVYKSFLGKVFYEGNPLHQGQLFKVISVLNDYGEEL